MRAFAAGAVAIGLLGAQGGYRDRQEYELTRRIQAQRDPHQRLVLLHEWSKAYPASALRQERFEQMIETEQALGRPGEMMATAREMVADEPRGSGNYWICLLAVGLRESSPAGLAQVERSARALLAPPAKPVAVTPHAWEEQRARNETLAHRALGWIALSHQDWPAAEAEFTLVLQRNPNDGEASYWIGNSLLARNQPARALYHLERSIAVKGEDGVPAEVKDRLIPFDQQLYVRVYGSLTGFAVLQRTVRARAFP